WLMASIGRPGKSWSGNEPEYTNPVYRMVARPSAARFRCQLRGSPPLYCCRSARATRVAPSAGAAVVEGAAAGAEAAAGAGAAVGPPAGGAVRDGEVTTLASGSIGASGSASGLTCHAPS